MCAAGPFSPPTPSLPSRLGVRSHGRGQSHDPLVSSLVETSSRYCGGGGGRGPTGGPPAGGACRGSTGLRRGRYSAAAPVAPPLLHACRAATLGAPPRAGPGGGRVAGAGGKGKAAPGVCWRRRGKEPPRRSPSTASPDRQRFLFRRPTAAAAGVPGWRDRRAGQDPRGGALHHFSGTDAGGGACRAPALTGLTVPSIPSALFRCDPTAAAYPSASTASHPAVPVAVTCLAAPLLRHAQRPPLGFLISFARGVFESCTRSHGVCLLGRCSLSLCVNWHFYHDDGAMGLLWWPIPSQCVTPYAVPARRC